MKSLPPNPKKLLRLAESEEARIPLAPYYPVILELRDGKQFSFAAITEWLNSRGLDTNQSAVYRAYAAAKRIPDAVAASQETDPDEYDPSN